MVFSQQYHQRSVSVSLSLSLCVSAARRGLRNWLDCVKIYVIFFWSCGFKVVVIVDDAALSRRNEAIDTINTTYTQQYTLCTCSWGYNYVGPALSSNSFCARYGTSSSAAPAPATEIETIFYYCFPDYSHIHSMEPTSERMNVRTHTLSRAMT